jgi:hypothetical protein
MQSPDNYELLHLVFGRPLFLTPPLVIPLISAARLLFGLDGHVVE